ncbi:MAG: PIG-L family deacetylase [bacterium]|nr:PIG-L family deacetylase [bacterium]
MPDTPLHIIAIGAHPDDCEYYFGGTAAKFAAAGHQVQFVSVTNGDAGHHRLSGAELVDRRRAETAEAARRLGIASSLVLDHHDGLLEPSLEARQQIIRLIREWRADLVLTHRPNDYHPDHRYTSLLVQDAAYLVLVPNICPETPVLRRNPIFLYLEDDFQRPNPFTPDIAVAIDDVWQTKIHALDAHVSQFYEWLPWCDWNEEPVPESEDERHAWLAGKTRHALGDAVRASLEQRYGTEPASHVTHAEAFELCEYGARPAHDELEGLFPR